MKKNIIKCLSLALCLLLLIGALCSCSSEHNNEDKAETSNTTENNSEENIESEKQTLRIYEKDDHTFSVWNYDENAETILLIFDNDKVVQSHYVFVENNDENTVTLYNGSDPEYKWRIQISYNNTEDTYTIFLGDDDNVLLFDDIDYSGVYSFKEEKEIIVDQDALENPLSFEVESRNANSIFTESYQSRANGNWHLTINKTDTQTLMIYEEEIFVLNYISVGQVKETIKGTYTILSDDGKYQEFKFVNADDATQVWTAKIWQTELKDDSGVAYDGIVYINSSNETMYYTGTKW